MCSRADNEPLLQYWFRQFREEPLRVLIVACIMALCFMYQDNREDMKEQNAALIEQLKASTKAMGEIAGKLSVMDGRLQHLEREHEAARNK